MMEEDEWMFFNYCDKCQKCTGMNDDDLGNVVQSLTWVKFNNW